MTKNCPNCSGTVVYQGLSTVECEGLGCANNPQQKTEKMVSWTEFLSEALQGSLDAQHERYLHQTKRRMSLHPYTAWFLRCNPHPIDPQPIQPGVMSDDVTMEFLNHLHKHKK